MNRQGIQTLLENLTGQDAPLRDEAPKDIDALDGTITGLGYSQLNELLLLFGFDRISRAFFRYLVDGKTDFEPAVAFKTVKQLRDGVERFRKLALLRYGNVKFGFKSLSTDAALLSEILEHMREIPECAFASRHDQVLSLQRIDHTEAYLTGYLIEDHLKERLKKDPNDKAAQELDRARTLVSEQANANHKAYLASDHLDVYVATSMRKKHEFMAVSRLTSDIFNHPELSGLKLRWFDPTQAKCPKRIDKGLSEALMLRRASCTIYLAQEGDTLGKDSELASTLAQGKPVVAYVPTITKKSFQTHLATLRESEPEKQEYEILLEQLRIYDSDAAWDNKVVQKWCADPHGIDLPAARERLQDRMATFYDERASLLSDKHPLSIQVNLQTGVANGVLVVRTTEKCARLIRAILTRTLQFEIGEDANCVTLRETISNCIYRVMTKDRMLTNTFWNFYLDATESDNAEQLSDRELVRRRPSTASNGESRFNLQQARNGRSDIADPTLSSIST